MTILQFYIVNFYYTYKIEIINFKFNYIGFLFRNGIMNRKLIVTFGICLMIVFTAVSIQAVTNLENEELIGKTRIKAIGTFAHCDIDGIVYGHIFIGVMGIVPVFNFDIEICDDKISSIIMTNHLLYCVILE